MLYSREVVTLNKMCRVGKKREKVMLLQLNSLFNAILLSLNKEENPDTCQNMDGPRGRYAK